MVFVGMIGTLMGMLASISAVFVALLTYRKIRKTGAIWSRFMLLVMEVSSLIFLSAAMGFVKNAFSIGDSWIYWAVNLGIYAVLAISVYRFYRGAFRVFSEILGVME